MSKILCTLKGDLCVPPTGLHVTMGFSIEPGTWKVPSSWEELLFP